MLEGTAAWKEVRIKDRREARLHRKESTQAAPAGIVSATFVTGHAKEMLGSRRICDWATDSWKTHRPHVVGSRRKCRAKPSVPLLMGRLLLLLIQWIQIVAEERGNHHQCFH